MILSHSTSSKASLPILNASSRLPEEGSKKINKCEEGGGGKKSAGYLNSAIHQIVYEYLGVTGIKNSFFFFNGRELDSQEFKKIVQKFSLKHFEKLYISTAGSNFNNELVELEQATTHWLNPNVVQKAYGEAFKAKCARGIHHLNGNGYITSQRRVIHVRDALSSDTCLDISELLNNDELINLRPYLLELMTRSAYFGREKSFNSIMTLSATRIPGLPYAQGLIIEANFLADALLAATDNGHEVIVKALKNSTRFNDIPEESLGGALVVAASNEDEVIVKALKDSGRFKDIPVTFFAAACLAAASSGHQVILKALKDSARFKDIPAQLLGKALVVAASNVKEPLQKKIRENKRNVDGASSSSSGKKRSFTDAKSDEKQLEKKQRPEE